MTITGKGHGGGDPTAYCERLTLSPEGDGARRWEEARAIAMLFRVLADRGLRGRLLEAAEGIEAGAALDPVIS